MRTGLTLLIIAVLTAGCGGSSERRFFQDRTEGGGVSAGGQGSISGGSSGAANGGTVSMAGDSGAGAVNGGAAGTGGGTVAGSSAGGNAPNGGFAGMASGGAGGSSMGTGGTSGGAGGSGGASGGGGKSSGGSAGAGGSGGTGGRFHVFLLLGGSNMAGYPEARAADKEENPRVRVLGFDDCTETGRQTDVWDTAAPPLHECSNGAIGPGDSFAKTLLPILPSTDSIGLVPCAISGAKIMTFVRFGGVKWNWLVQRARAALQAGGVIDGILFHQGESDTSDVDWPRMVHQLVTDLRTELGIPNAPFLAGELAYQGNRSSHNTLVNGLRSTISDSAVVSADGLAVDPADPSNVLFGHDAQVELGRRYALKMIEARGW